MVLQSGAAVAVVWAYTRTQTCASDLWVEGIHTTSRDTPSRLRSRLWHLPSQRQSADSEKPNELQTTAGIHRHTSKVLGRPLRRRLSWVSELQKWLSMCLARHLSACLFHVSASGAIIAAATANHRRLSQQNHYKTRVSLIVLGRISRHFVIHFAKIPTKSSSGIRT